MKTLLYSFLVLFVANAAFAGKLQNEDFKSATEIVSAGGTVAQLLNDTKIYVTANGVNDRLFNAIQNGQLGGVSASGSGIEILPNPGFESAQGTSGWSNSGGSYVVVTSGVHLLFGRFSASWTASASAQTFASTLVDIKGLAGQNCSASVFYTYGGTSGDYSLQAVDGSANVLASQPLASRSIAGPPAVISFPCGALTTSQLRLRLLSNVASPAIIYFDNAHLGSFDLLSLHLVGDTSSYVPSISSSGGAGAVKGTTTLDTAYFNRDASYLNLKYDYIQTVAGTAGPAGTYLISLPAGLLIDTSVQPASTSDTGRSAVGYGTLRSATDHLVCTTTVYDSSHLSATCTSDTVAQTPWGTTLGSFATTAVEASLFARVPIVGWQAVNAYRPDQLPATWSGYHDATCSWSITSASFTDPSGDASCALVERDNTNMGSVTSALATGNPLPGIVFTPPLAGKFEICAEFAPSVDATPQAAAFQLTDGVAPFANREVGWGTTSIRTPAQICGYYAVSSVTPKTIKLQWKSPADTVNVSAGQAISAVSWTIKSLQTPIPAPVIIGSVVSGSGGIDHVEHASLSAVCTTASCALSNFTSGITSVSRSGTGAYAVNFAVGAYTVAPSCFFNLITSSGAVRAVVANSDVSPTVSAYSEQTLDLATDTVVDTRFDVMCIGQR